MEEKIETKIKEKKDKGVYVRVHPELLELLEVLKVKLSELSYGVLTENVSIYELTGILAKKIKGRL